jgi:hypothetical protein
MNDNQGKRFADKTAGTARETFEKGSAAAEESARGMERSYSSAAEGIRDFNLRLIEMTQTNTMAALDFARRGSNLLPERCQLPGLLGHRLELLAGVR